ncbi:MDR family MFS transporter [Aneurinibacillus terranovensis]|uniref:MDR family MFS transporter n=1 Tax=Aneurinibacillus terranovensis TaxID=278991 RepID=UPI00041B5A40|nr:MDR family MFS transporter [Aneurinibacillus terranovensis]
MVKRTNRKVVFISIILAMFMASVEGTIVATAMPSIVGVLGGFSLFSWVFSVFLLMQAVTVPIYGKLSDLFGRKPVFVFGIIVFLIGSVLCGFAASMKWLILYRLIQGLGAGAVQPIATTIVGDMYTLDERARIQGYLSSVWGISSIVGPALGGVFVQYLHWAWVFWINLPLGAAAIIGIVFFLHEDVERKQVRIDYPGSVLLVIWVSALILILTQGGTVLPWNSLPLLILVGLFLSGFILFIIHEKNSSEPVMPLKIWNHRLIAAANIAALITGSIMIAVSSFLPTYVQGVMGQPPIISGFTLSMMSLGWPIASLIGGRLIIKIGYKKTALIGGAALVLGSVVLATIHHTQKLLLIGAGTFLIGAGMGFASNTFVVAIQSSVERSVRGVATASYMFMRILGNTIGAALFGGLLNSRLHTLLRKEGLRYSLDEVTRILLHTAVRKTFPSHVIAAMQRGLHGSLHTVYWGVLLAAAAALLVILSLPKQKTAYLQ